MAQLEVWQQESLKTNCQNAKTYKSYNTLDKLLETRGVQQELKCQNGVVETLANRHFFEEAAKKT